MSESLTATVVGAVVGIIATLLTIFLTPRLQHRFWKRQRLAELRFEVADKINWLLAEYITDYTAHEGSATPNRPSTEFFRAIRVSTAMVKALFSEEAYRTFKAVEEMLGPGLGPPGRRRTVEEFVQAHDKAMHSIYAEIGLDLPPAKAKPASPPGR